MTLAPVDASRTRLSWLASAIFGAAAMLAVQSGSPHIPGNDGYYHVKMAALLSERGFMQTFPWLRWTIFADGFVSHHHGFHLLLWPFVRLSTWFTGDPTLGAKTAAAVAMAAVFALFDALLRRRRVPHPALWLVLLTVVPWHFWLRMGYIRAPMAALPLLLLAIHWTIAGRTWALGVLAYVFTQVYGGAVLFPLVPGSFLAGAILARGDRRRGFVQLGLSLAGIALGLVLNPYFPANLSFLYTQLFETGLGAARDVGGEWKPYDAWALFVQAAPLAAVWGGCLLLRLRAGVAASAAEAGLLILNVAFFVLMLKSRRFVEYWPVMALLNAAEFAAVAAASGVGLAAEGRVRGRWANVVLLVVALIGVFNLRVARARLVPTHDVPAFREAMTFLRDHSPPGSLVFTDDWDVFPVCFYFNDHNIYAVGLDPEFTRCRYAALWDRYRRITRAELPARLPDGIDDDHGREIAYDDITDVFGASYALVAKDHGALYRALSARPERFVRVHPPVDAADKGQPPVTVFEARRSATRSPS